MKFKPKKIYIHRKVQNNPVTQRILHHPSLSGIEQVVVGSTQDIQKEYLPAKGNDFYENTAKNIKTGGRYLP